MVVGDDGLDANPLLNRFNLSLSRSRGRGGGDPLVLGVQEDGGRLLLRRPWATSVFMVVVTEDFESVD